MAGGGPDQLVEASVELRIAQGVPLAHARAHVFYHGVKLSQILCRDPRRGATGEEALECDPDFLYLQRLALVDQPDPGPSVALKDDQTLLVQPDESGANRRSARTDQLRDRGFDQPLIWMKPPADDRFA